MTLEVVFDAKNWVNPTHGWFAIHSHGEMEWPQVSLRDFGIPDLYVGFVEPDWYNDEKRREAYNSNVAHQLPPKLVFEKEFICRLPAIGISPLLYTDEMQKSINSWAIGHLKWYKTFLSLPREIQFVHCTMQGHKFVWHLTEEKCEMGCHTIGLWRD
jgi:hypothetical protein